MAEVQEANGETAEDDGEVEPGEKGAFIGEEDFGFDAGGKGDAFAGSRLEEGLSGHTVGDQIGSWCNRCNGTRSGRLEEGTTELESLDLLILLLRRRSV